MGKFKYYAVRNGIKPGIYTTWEECRRQVKKYPDAMYKGFMTKAEAEEYNGVTVTHVGDPKPKKKKRTPVTKVMVYTDGGTRNTGNYKGGHVKPTDKAAWAYLIKWGTSDDPKQVDGSEGQYGATNNQMELTGFIEALKKLIALQLNHRNIIFTLDSKYVLNPLTKGWLRNWQARNWSKVANVELWQEVVELLPAFTHLSYKWTKGHANNQGNEYVDHKLNVTMDNMLNIAGDSRNEY